MYCGRALGLDGGGLLGQEARLPSAFMGSLEFGVLYVKGIISQMLI